MRIENYAEQPRGTNVIASFDVYIDEYELTRRKWKLIRTKNGGVFVSDYSILEKETNSWEPLTFFSKEKEMLLKKDILKELEHFTGGL